MNISLSVTTTDMPVLIAWLQLQRIEQRPHPSMQGIQIQHERQWLSLIWNRLQYRYTADRRLAPVINAFTERSES
jgi:hypothetical protein